MPLTTPWRVWVWRFRKGVGSRIGKPQDVATGRHLLYAQPQPLAGRDVHTFAATGRHEGAGGAAVEQRQVDLAL